MSEFRIANEDTGLLDSLRAELTEKLGAKRRRKSRKKARDKDTREEVVERDLGKHVESLDGLYEKFTSPGRRDVPDRIVTEGHGWDRAAHLLHDFIKAQYPRGPSTLLSTHAGRKVVVREIVAQMIYLVECKAPGKKPNKRQKRDHERRRKLGVTVRVYDGEWRE